MADDRKGRLKKLHKRGCFDYFETFGAMASEAVREADLLLEVIEGFTDSAAVEERLGEAHSIEEACDDLVRAIVMAADEDFLPPIEREDIVELAIALDEIVDDIEKVIKNLFMYDVDAIEPRAVEMCRLIREECCIMDDAMGFFRDFRKPKKLRACAGKIDAIETKMDDLYLYGVRELFTGGGRPDHILRWRLMFSAIEECSDTVEHGVDLMVRVVVKNA